MKEIIYNRKKAVEYAKKWAYSRNPNYYNFDNVGGDCTSFVSQCIYEGCKVMNYNVRNGWYYINGYNKSPSWSGVEYMYNFLINNKGIGPKGKEVSINNVEQGDVIQFRFDKNIFSHSAIVTDINALGVFVTTHTEDVFNKIINKYTYNDIRFIHIEKIIYY